MNDSSSPASAQDAQETPRALNALPARAPTGPLAAFAPAGPHEAAKLRIAATIDAARDEILDLSHRIHALPEVAFEEERAAAWIAEILDSHGFAVGLLQADLGSYRVAGPACKPTLPTRSGAVTGNFDMVDFITSPASIRQAGS